MIEEITFIVRPEDEHDERVLKHKAAEALSKKNINARNEDIRLIIAKRSIDARHGRIRICLRCKAYIGETPDERSASSLPYNSKSPFPNGSVPTEQDASSSSDPVPPDCSAHSACLKTASRR